jgi:autotransporter-associated beta strand protein
MQKYRSRKLLAAAAASVGMTALLTHDALAYVELDLQATYIKDSADHLNAIPFADPKHITANIGDRVLMDVVVRIGGTNALQLHANFDGSAPSDTANDDTFQALAGGFKSVGGLRGDFDNTDHSGQVAPFSSSGSSNGILQDFDSDGDLDLGASGTDVEFMWAAHAGRAQAATISASSTRGTRFGVSSALVPDFMEDFGGELTQIPRARIIDSSNSQLLLGELEWVVTSGSGAGDVNFVPRTNLDVTALWFEDGISTGKNPLNASFFLGLPVHIELAGAPSARQLVWNPGSTTWNQSNSNWLNNGATAVYADGEGANFTTSGVGPVIVDAGGVSPKNVSISNTTGTYTFSGGSINGTGSVIKAGAGTAVFTVANGYSGGTLLTGGTLVVDGGDNRLGAPGAPVTFTGGILRTATTGIISARNFYIDSASGTFNSNGLDSSFTGALQGEGLFTKTGAGTLTLLADNPHSGDKRISAGTLRIGNGGNTGSIVGNVSLSGSTTNLTFDRGSDLTYAGVISGFGSVTKRGSGTLTLTGTNEYSGGTTIDQGTLRIGDGGTTGDIVGTVVNNAILEHNRSGFLNFSAQIVGTGTFIKSGPQRLTLTSSSTSTYTGPTIVTQGDLRIGGFNSGSMFTNVTLQNNSLLSFQRNGTVLTFTGNITGNGSLAQFGNAGNTVILTGTNTYTGTTTVNSGTLQVGNNGSSGTIPNTNVVVSDTLRWNRSDSLTFTGDISGTGQMFKLGAGTLVLTGTDSRIGPTIITRGTLQIGNGGTTGSIDSSSNITTSDALVFNRSNSLTYGGVIFGSGSVTKQGNGTLTLTKPMVYTGPTTVAAGKLALDANFTTSSSITVTGGTLELLPNGNRLIRTPSLSLTAGRVDLQDNKLITRTPVGSLVGSTYTGVSGLIQSGRNGDPLPHWDGNGIVTSQSNAAGGNYTSIGVARASDVRPATATATGTWAGQTITGTDTLVMYTYGGDATLDGKIDIDDYVRIDAGLTGHLSGWSNGDFNYDGKVNVDDYANAIDANLITQGTPFSTAGGLGEIAATSGVNAVPEPAGISLFIGTGALVLRRRRRLVG